MAVPEAGAWVENWLSPPRFAVYLRAADGDRERAMALYEWNAACSAAFQRDLGHLEVGLRNAYDRALVEHTPEGRPHWIFDADRYFPPRRQKAANGVAYDANHKTRSLVTTAIKEAEGTPRAEGITQPPPGKVIAELQFGFWRYLSVRRHDNTMWIPYLHHAFRPGTSRQDVDRPVARLHKLRNRVAHHEPLLTTDLAGYCADLLTVAGLIAPQLRSYIDTTSSCPSLLASRPV